MNLAKARRIKKALYKAGFLAKIVCDRAALEALLVEIRSANLPDTASLDAVILQAEGAIALATGGEVRP